MVFIVNGKKYLVSCVPLEAQNSSMYRHWSPTSVVHVTDSNGEKVGLGMVDSLDGVAPAEDNMDHDDIDALLSVVQRVVADAGEKNNAR